MAASKKRMRNASILNFVFSNRGSHGSVEDKVTSGTTKSNGVGNEHSSEETIGAGEPDSENNADSTGGQIGQRPSKKRRYGFVVDWTKTRPWLDRNCKGEMICTWCIRTGKTNAFTQGNTNFRTTTLDRHVEITEHQQAIKDMKLSEGFKTVVSNAIHKRSESLVRALEIVYWLAKENIASLKFASFLNGIKLHVHRSTIRKATEDISNDRHEFVTALEQQMNRRFPKDSTQIANCFDVLGLRSLSFLSSNEREDYGRDKIETLVKHFGNERPGTEPPINAPEHLLTEWKLAKNIILQEMYPRDRMPELWKLVHQHHASTFPNLLKLVSIALVMPYQTADCERGFSQQNLTKTASRNRLEGKTLNRLMLINLEGPAIRDFDFARALVIWKNKKERRLYQK